MAKTNFQDPGSSEIRSTHISGVMEAINKIEESLNMDTVAETDVVLPELFISEDDRYRIFQAPEGKRNWLNSPAPVIKKNGVVISTGFGIDYGGGAVVFNPPLTASDAVIASFTRTKNTSGFNAHLAEETTDAHKIGNITGLETVLNNKAETATYSAVIASANWDGAEAPYIQTITVEGITSNDNPIIDIDLSETEDYEEELAILEAWGLVYRITTDEDEITIYAIEKPEVDIPIILKVVR